MKAKSKAEEDRMVGAAVRASDPEMFKRLLKLAEEYKEQKAEKKR